MIELNRITIEDIETKDFAVTSKGYSQQEVDTYLDAICDELETREREMDALRRELTAAKSRVPAAAPQAAVVQADSFREILEMAQRVKEEVIAEANAKAQKIVEDAQEAITNKLGNLEKEKEDLEAQIEALKAALEAHKDGLKQLIDASMTILD